MCQAFLTFFFTHYEEVAFELYLRCIGFGYNGIITDSNADLLWQKGQIKEEFETIGMNGISGIEKLQHFYQINQFYVNDL